MFQRPWLLPEQQPHLADRPMIGSRLKMRLLFAYYVHSPKHEVRLRIDVADVMVVSSSWAFCISSGPITCENKVYIELLLRE